MFQIIKPSNNNPDILTVSTLNGNIYSVEELKLFVELVCKKVALNSLCHILEYNYYNHDLLQTVIHDISMGYQNHGIVSITGSAKKYHEELFDAMYITPLDDLPMMLNGDETITPVVKWRLQIGK